ncbi:hypothetical protein KHS38_08410 [Mucilaginibacter sp. Bleaf8]|uniref:M57 family metalloprotease n=1 Tax=Mucilaginibacter sp. Bleaf8 TaxID=2834430 RepID=UPI001BCCE52B|nr:M57 family metalloprotease [Mucilaginibacter sp. Bleaf8]MBS7564428.1 hypothetical protein [Mucilaginibacter sp. Bleaf8]
MKNKFLLRASLCTVLAASIFFSCTKKNDVAQTSQDEVSTAVKQKIAELGFSTDQVRKTDGGYLVEGDILLTEANLSEASSSPVLRIAENEQYRTTNLVKNLPRTITVSVSNLPTVYTTAATNAVARYNQLNLTLKFQMVSSGGQINIVGFNQGPSGGYITLGSGGFPTTSGNPYSQIRMNTNTAAYGTNPNVGYLTSVLQHEIGHCIGFRHTDYMNRAYSCGGTATNEGSTYSSSNPQNYPGAVQIPGTPSTPDAGSFMLACSNGADRTFNANDVVALNYLY